MCLFPSSRADFSPVWDGFPYAFLYFSLQITKFPGKELLVLSVFFLFCLFVCLFFRPDREQIL